MNDSFVSESPIKPPIFAGITSISSKVGTIRQDEDGIRFVLLPPILSFLGTKEVKSKKHEYFIRMGLGVSYELLS